MWDVNQNVFLGASSGSRSAPEGVATWRWDGESWDLLNVKSESGGIAGDPPMILGKFKGQLRLTPCVQPPVSNPLASNEVLAFCQ